MNRYPLASSPLHLGAMHLKNRIVMPPMGTQFADENGFVTDRQIDHYVQRALGGTGLVITEHAGICEEGRAIRRMLMLSTGEHTAGVKELVDAVHRAGAKIAVQLNHAGKDVTVAELAAADLEYIRKKWAEAAARAKSSGADGIELHMANGYLMHKFLSPVTNTRTDAYGGSPIARAKFAGEVLRAVKEAVGEAVGEDFPVWCRISVNECLDGGIDIAMAKVTAAVLEKAGAVAIHISTGSQMSMFGMHPTYYRADCINAGLAKELKAAIGIPVIAVGKIRSLEAAETILQQGCCDLVAMGRPQIADPELVNKSLQGRLDEVIPCLSCSRCVKAYREGGVRCTVNPAVGCAVADRPTAAKTPRKIFVIGGGPAGLKCAETCAKAGHKVTLFEKENTLGGQINRGKLPPHKDNMQEFVDYLVRQTENAGVSIKLGTEAGENLAELDPDVIVIATGAEPRVLPDGRGGMLCAPAPRSGSRAALPILTFEDVLQENENVAQKLGDKVLVLGGGFVGAEIADYIAALGKSVTLVEMRAEIAFDAVAHLKHDLMEQLTERKVTVLTNTKATGFRDGGVLLESNGNETFLPDHTVVLAVGLTPRADVSWEKCPKAKVLKIGDCLQPREIVDALEEGYAAAAKIERLYD